MENSLQLGTSLVQFQKRREGRGERGGVRGKEKWASQMVFLKTDIGH
jgi:hypothetical protein